MPQRVSQSHDNPPFLAPSGPSWRCGIIGGAKQPFTQTYTHTVRTPPSYGLGAIPGMSKMVSPFVSPLFLPDDGDPLSRDGCGPESHLERLKYNKALPSQRIEHQIKENGGKAWL